MQKERKRFSLRSPSKGLFYGKLLAEIALQQTLEGAAVPGLVRPRLSCSCLGHITSYTAPNVFKYTPAHTSPRLFSELCSPLPQFFPYLTSVKVTGISWIPCSIVIQLMVSDLDYVAFLPHPVPGTLPFVTAYRMQAHWHARS